MGRSRVTGIVVRQHRSHYFVKGDDGQEHLCAVSSKLRKDLEYPEADSASRRRRVQEVREIGKTSAVVVGDRVTVELGDENSMIMEVAARRTILSRESPGRRNIEQIIAANVDQVLAVVSVQSPAFNADLLNRVLAGAEFQGLDAIICPTKIDLRVPEDVLEALAGYPEDYPVVMASAVTGEGVDRIRELLRDKTTVATGLSGVGKTSIINALEPGLDLRVQPVNKRTGQGRHTTTHTELIPLSNGGHYVDAPGLRELSLWSVEPEEIPTLFPEIELLVSECRFGFSCVHDREPGCAVRAAVEEGAVAEHRYASYLAIRRDAEQASSDVREKRRPRPT
jgi:ribosome biogenesis GTPase / thiamine phosphate phosphatase